MTSEIKPGVRCLYRTARHGRGGSMPVQVIRVQGCMCRVIVYSQWYPDRATVETFFVRKSSLTIDPSKKQSRS